MLKRTTTESGDRGEDGGDGGGGRWVGLDQSDCQMLENPLFWWFNHGEAVCMYTYIGY